MRRDLAVVLILGCLSSVGCQSLAPPGSEIVHVTPPPPPQKQREAGACDISVPPDGVGAAEAGSPSGDVDAGDATVDAGNTRDAGDGSALRAALSAAVAGEVVCLSPGRYVLKDTLTIAAANVTLRGTHGAVLDFSGQRAGDAISVTANGATLDSFHVADPRGIGVHGVGLDGVKVRNLRVDWSTKPSDPSNAFGVSIEGSSRVLVEDTVVSGATDTGIRIAQSKTAIVRNDEVTGNGAGIVVQNSTDVEVTTNQSHDNAAGILVLNEPGFDVKNGTGVNVHDNMVQTNNAPNQSAASGAINLVPSGTGIYVLAADGNEIHGNTVENNSTYGIAVVSWYLAFDVGAANADPAFNRYPEGNSVHDNTASGNGTMPLDRGANITFAIRVQTLPDILWDGIVDTKIYGDAGPPPAGPDAGTSLEGIPGDLRNCFENNGAATFLDLDLTDVGRFKSSDLAPFACEHPALAPIQL